MHKINNSSICLYFELRNTDNKFQVKCLLFIICVLQKKLFCLGTHHMHMSKMHAGKSWYYFLFANITKFYDEKNKQKRNIGKIICELNCS